VSIINTFKKKIEVASNAQGKTKFFAYCEVILFPLSLLVILVLFLNIPFHFILKDTILAKTMMVLSVAAVGYLTNYIAIKMLFEPYNKEGLHWLKIITLGCWQQGLIPENKNNLAIKAGEQIEGKLIKPKELADEICNIIKNRIQDVNTINKLKLWIKELLEQNKDKIIEFGIVELKKYLKEKMPELLSKKRVTKYIHYIINFVKKEEIKNIISKKIISTLQNRVPDLMDIIRTELSKIIVDFFNSSEYKGDIIAPTLFDTIKSTIKSIGRNIIGVEKISSLLIKFINWKSVEDIIYKKISEENTQKIIEEEIISTCNSLLNWLNSKEGDIKFDEILKNIREKVELLFNKYFDKTINSLFDKVINSENFYTWIENFLQNSAKPKIEEIIDTEGKKFILQDLNISKKVKNTIENLDIKEVHEIIDNLAAQHLVAIQVLGFILGGAIGLLQLLF
jgi:uncharacterized membrane protein YheB (UPF0754 family)